MFYSIMKRKGKSIVDILLVATFLCFMLLSIVQVFFRYVLNNSLSWSEELARILFVWATYLGIAVVSRDKEQIIVDVLGNTKGRMVSMLDLISKILTAVILGYLSYLSMEYILTLVSRGMATTVLRVPKYIPVGSVLTGAVVSIIFLLCQMYKEDIRHMDAGVGEDGSVDADVEAALAVLHRLEEEKEGKA